MNKFSLLMIFLLIIPVVFAQYTIQKISPEIYTTQDYNIPKIDYVKVCDEKQTKCENNNFFACKRNQWTTLQKCSSNQYCDSYKGCVEKPQISSYKPQITPTQSIITPKIPPSCIEGNTRCYKENSLQICKNNQWLIRQQCSNNEECIPKKGCVTKIPIVKNTCEKTRTGVKGIYNGREYNYPATCQGNLLFNYECKPDGTGYLMTQTDCGTQRCSNGRCNVDTCQNTEKGVRGLFRGNNYNYDYTCQDSSFFTYNCGEEGKYVMQQERCEFGCNSNGCNINACEQTSRGVRGLFRGREYNYQEKCQDNLLFTYECSPEGTYVMMQTNCGNQGCSNGQCNIDTCQNTENGVRGIFRGNNYNYENKCQDNSYFTYQCGNEGRYVMQEKRCETDEYCVEGKGCEKSSVIKKPIMINKVWSYFTNVFAEEEKLDAKLEIAEKNYEGRIKDLQKKHEERMSELLQAEERTNQLYNMLASTMKTMNEMRGIGRGERSNLDSEETENAIDKLEKALDENQKNKEETKKELEKLSKNLENLKTYINDLKTKKLSQAELESYLEDLEEQMNAISDDAQLANVELQNMLQKQQQALQMLSQISKNMHDTTMAVIHNMLESEASADTNEQSQTNEGVPVNINAFVQWVIREGYLETTEDLGYYAEKVKFFNEMKKQIRDEVKERRKALTEENVKEVIEGKSEIIEELKELNEQNVSCNEQGLYYGCNNPPYTTSESCSEIARQQYANEGYTDLSLNCCTQENWGWNCYLNGLAPADQQSYVTTCTCIGENCTPLN